MDYNAKRKIVGGVVYIFCAFMLVTILSIAIITAIGSANKSDPKDTVPVKDTTSALDTKDNATTKPVQSDTTSPPATDTTAAPAVNTDTSNAEPVSNLPYEYSLPVTGHLIKGYTSELAVYSLTMNDYRTHLGLDVSAPVGTNVCAFADGKITNVYTDPFMGNCIIIEHGGGLKSYYMNLGGEYPQGIAEGAAVKCGQTIASVGDSAALETADNDHLHFEVTLNGVHVNPLDYIEYEDTQVDNDYEDAPVEE